LLLKIPQGTQNNYFRIKCLEVGYTPPENFVSPDIGRKSLDYGFEKGSKLFS
jgi:hypothetical protein